MKPKSTEELIRRAKELLKEHESIAAQFNSVKEKYEKRDRKLLREELAKLEKRNQE